MSSYDRRAKRSTLNTVILVLFLIAVLLAAATLTLLHLRAARENGPNSAQVSGSQSVTISPSGPPASSDAVPSYSTTDPVPSPSTPGETSSNSDELPWYLTLVNPTHPLPEDFSVETVALNNIMSFDARAIDALREMLADCEAAGLQPLVCSAYRSTQTQETLFQRQIDRYMANGMTYEDAYATTAKEIAVPGTSEHSLGLAADICATSYQLLVEEQENTAEQQWLMAHCAEYGFILRYPKDKEDITAIIYEPWHYRYVGKEYARKITDSGLCLEEYLAREFGVE